MDKPETLEALFVGRHFDREVIILCVRWYLRFRLQPARPRAFSGLVESEGPSETGLIYDSWVSGLHPTGNPGIIYQPRFGRPPLIPPGLKML